MSRNHKAFLVPLSFCLLVVLSTTAVSHKIRDGFSEYSVISERINSQLDELKFGLQKAHSKVESIMKTQNKVSEELSDLERSIIDLSRINELIQKDIKYFLEENAPKTLSSWKSSKHQRGRKAYDEHFNSLENFNPIQRATIPSNCAEATISNNLLEDKYLLNIPNGNTKPFFAYCIHENGTERAWTIIQRREDGKVDFNREWSDYAEGFGDLYGEYWLGLERVHAMTVNQPHELWILLEDYQGQKRFAKYSKFSIGSEEDGYKLTVSGYLGTAGDSFSRHNNMKFSTLDVNNDEVNTNCARQYKGGWWYRNCYDCNLNGVFYSLSDHKTEFGINWNAWLSYDTSLRYTHMAIRPL